MNWMQRRRAAMMGVKKNQAVMLTDGSYDGGKIVVSNGNHMVVNSPTTYAKNPIPLTKPVPVSAGDTLSFKYSGQSNAKARYMGVRYNNSTLQHIGNNKPGENIWYNLIASTSGNITDFSFQANEGGWVADMDISIKLNDEVIF